MNSSDLQPLSSIRDQFEIYKYQEKTTGKPFVYFDNAATTHKPKVVVDSQLDFYTKYNSNIHRGVYSLSDQATNLYNQSRKTVAEFLGVEDTREIVFTSGTTEGINLLSNGLASQLQAGDEVLISQAEHNANIVPWQILSKKLNLNIRWIPLLETGELDLQSLKNLLSEKTKVVAVTQASNVLGLINNLSEISKLVRQTKAFLVVDGAQAISHVPVNLGKDFDVDFYTFSGHKVFAPMGVGILYGKLEKLAMLDLYQGGGDMIESVSHKGFVANGLPYKFEAGTPNVAGVYGLAKALEWLQDIRKKTFLIDRAGINGVGIFEYESIITQYLVQKLQAIDGLKILGSATTKRVGLASFVISGISSFDVATYLDQKGICARVGKHCAHPLYDYLEITDSIRVSINFLNNFDEVDYLCDSLIDVIKILN